MAKHDEVIDPHHSYDVRGMTAFVAALHLICVYSVRACTAAVYQVRIRRQKYYRNRWQSLFAPTSVSVALLHTYLEIYATFFLNYDCRFFYHSAVIFLKRRMCFGTGFTEADDKSLPKATTIAVHAFVLQ